MRRRLAMTALVLTIGALGACGDDDDSDDSSSDTTATTAADSGSGGSGELTVTSASVDATFVLTTCDNPDESTLDALGSDDDENTVEVSIDGGEGTVTIEGSNQASGIFEDGTVDALAIGDAGDITGSGTFTGGESFEFTGSCAG